MNVKTLCGLREHSRRRPLLGPEPNLRQGSFVTPNKFAKEPAMPLRINGPGKNFDSRNPGPGNLGLATIHCQEPSDLNSGLGDLLGDGAMLVISLDQLRPRLFG
jgi:hypothetical protein